MINEGLYYSCLCQVLPEKIPLQSAMLMPRAGALRDVASMQSCFANARRSISGRKVLLKHHCHFMGCSFVAVCLLVLNLSVSTLHPFETGLGMNEIEH